MRKGTASETYRHNHPQTKVLTTDLTQIHDLDSILDAGKCEIEGIIGGPPCQGFSLSGSRDPKDPRNSLLRNIWKKWKKNRNDKKDGSKASSRLFLFEEDTEMQQKKKKEPKEIRSRQHIKKVGLQSVKEKSYAKHMSMITPAHGCLEKEELYIVRNVHSFLGSIHERHHFPYPVELTGIELEERSFKMKKEKGTIVKLEFLLEAWDEHMPMCIRASYSEDGENDYPEEYLVDSANDIKKALDEILDKSSLDRETNIRIEYETSGWIPLKAEVSMTGMTLGFFRFKPDGITFLPPKRVDEETTREYLAAPFNNADSFLKECIVDSMAHLIKKLDED